MKSERLLIVSKSILSMLTIFNASKKDRAGVYFLKWKLLLLKDIRFFFKNKNLYWKGVYYA